MTHEGAPAPGDRPTRPATAPTTPPATTVPPPPQTRRLFIGGPLHGQVMDTHGENYFVEPRTVAHSPFDVTFEQVTYSATRWAGIRSDNGARYERTVMSTNGTRGNKLALQEALLLAWQNGHIHT